MPILNLKISGQGNSELSLQMTKELTDLTSKYLKKDPEVTVVTITYIQDKDWFLNKESLVDLNKKSFYMDIKITESTNLKLEKEQYIKSVFQLMKNILGDLLNESYVYVEEVKGDSYGYAGLTQEFRYINNKQRKS